MTTQIILTVQLRGAAPFCQTLNSRSQKWVRIQCRHKKERSHQTKYSMDTIKIKCTVARQRAVMSWAALSAAVQAGKTILTSPSCKVAPERAINHTSPTSLPSRKWSLGICVRNLAKIKLVMTFLKFTNTQSSKRKTVIIRVTTNSFCRWTTS